MVGDCHEGLVFLTAAFVHEKIIVTASAAARIGAAGRGTRRVDGAAPLVGIEEAADAAEVFVILAPHRILMPMGFFGEALPGVVERQAEMLCQASDVALRQRDYGIGAAVTGAVEAVVHGLCDH